MSKLTWDEYWMLMAKLASKRGTCCKRQVGACLVRENHLISTGYNGTVKGYPNCNEGGCYRCNHPEEFPSGKGYDVCVCAHAERNAIDIAASMGVATKGSTIYLIGFKSLPCRACAISIIQAGVEEVCILDEKQETQAESLEHDLFDKCCIKVRRLTLRPQVIELFDEIDRRLIF